MKKSRRLLHQFQTLIVSLLIVGSSVFLCAPMGVEAAESVSLLASQSVTIDDVMTQAVANEVGILDSEEITLSSGYWARINSTTNEFAMASGLVADSVYKVDITVDCAISPSVTGTGAILRSFSLIIGNTYDVINGNAISVTNNYSSSVNRTYYLTGEFLMASRTAVVRGVVTNSKAATLSLDFNFNLHINSISEVSNASSDEYQNGYNAGYSDGESVGYGNGYSEGFSNGQSSVDTDSFYNNGFQAGVDSVDTDSFYDAGYQAGYDAAYTSGYDTGYDAGYQSAMSRIDGWGADTSEYPLLLARSLDRSFTHRVYVTECDPTVFNSPKILGFSSNFDIDPNHTYKIVVDIHSCGLEDGASSDNICFLSEQDYYLEVGSFSYPLGYFVGDTVNVCYIPGSNMTSNLSFVWRPILSLYSEDFDNGLCYYSVNFDVLIYDCGPSGDTQNHIANQTDQLVNGFNDSQGGSVNDSFSGHVNDYNTAEDSLFTSAQTGLNNFQFFDLASIPAVVTGLSFVATTMTGWFNAAGGASGVGIVLSLLFTVMIVAMALGLYRFYQGKK